MNKNIDTKEFNKAKKEFKKLSKFQLIEIIYQLQSLTLSLKSRNVELERMLEERGQLIEEYKKEIITLNKTEDLIKVIKENNELQKNKKLKHKTLIQKIHNFVKGVFHDKNS